MALQEGADTVGAVDRVGIENQGFLTSQQGQQVHFQIGDEAFGRPLAPIAELACQAALGEDGYGAHGFVRRGRFDIDGPFSARGAAIGQGQVQADPGLVKIEALVERNRIDLAVIAAGVGLDPGRVLRGSQVVFFFGCCRAVSTWRAWSRDSPGPRRCPCSAYRVPAT
jgi:hypothetical protein